MWSKFFFAVNINHFSGALSSLISWHFCQILYCHLIPKNSHRHFEENDSQNAIFPYRIFSKSSGAKKWHCIIITITITMGLRGFLYLISVPKNSRRSPRLLSNPNSLFQCIYLYSWVTLLARIFSYL